MSEEWRRRPPKRSRRDRGAEEDPTGVSADEPPPGAAGLPGHAGEDENSWRSREGETHPDFPMYPHPGGDMPFPPTYPASASGPHPFVPPGPMPWGYGPPMNYPIYPSYQSQPYPPHYQPLMPPQYYPEHPTQHAPARFPGQPYAEGRESLPGVISSTVGAGGSVKEPSSQGGDSKASEASVDASSHTDLQDYDEDADSDKKMSAGETGGDMSSASRVRLYVKSKIPTRQETLDRRARKNAQSRARAAKLRERIIEIQEKPEEERTEEENDILYSYQNRRQRKNDRSRERAIEKKSEIDRILSKPDKKRTKIENDFLKTALTAKQRKNQGDRIRRQRIKHMRRGGQRGGSSDDDDSESTSTPSHHVTSVGFASGMSEIPMSPLPTSVTQHPSLHSPGPFGSPGLMPNIAFPSPPNSRRPVGAPGVLEPSRGSRAQADPSSVLPLPFMPPAQGYNPQASPAARTQLHMPQHSARVEQRRHPDGSMSISIGRSSGGSPFGGETRLPLPGEPSSPDISSAAGAAVNLSDVSHLLLYNDNGDDPEGTGERPDETAHKAI